MKTDKHVNTQKNARIAEALELLTRACIERGISVSADYRVSEADAAGLLGYAEGSFKNLRTMGVAPPHYRRTVAGCRISYRLSELAEWVELGREEF